VVPGIDIGLYFGGWGGWGWGGWGWGPNWFGGNIFIDNSFFHRYGFRGISTEEEAWAGPRGRMIRHTGSACRMPIAKWPAGLAAARAAIPARGARAQAIAGRALSNASEIRV
jgi:hypothetical protein